MPPENPDTVTSKILVNGVDRLLVLNGETLSNIRREKSRNSRCSWKSLGSMQ